MLYYVNTDWVESMLILYLIQFIKVFLHNHIYAKYIALKALEWSRKSLQFK